MYRDDDSLEERLQEMEAGNDEFATGGEGGQEAAELSSLVSLAASIRSLPHPEQSSNVARSEKRRLMTAARERKRANSRPAWSPNGGFTGQWLVIPAVAGAALVVLMAFILAAGAGLYFAGPRGAQAATLSDATGVVEVWDVGGSGGWTLVSNGDQVKAGQRLRTGVDSRVAMTFFDGTQVQLDPMTDLVLSQVDGDWGKELQVSLIQNAGQTSHQVVPLKGSAATYSVLTPSGDASVKGTSFNVLVEESGDSIFAVQNGAVLVSNDSEETFLAAGLGLVTELGQPLAAKSYLFTLFGVLEDMSGKTWSVEGVEFTVKGGTRLDIGLTQGDLVLVTGRVTKQNQWIADSVIAHESDASGGTLSGIVTGISEGGVEVNGFPFVILDVQPEVSPGDLVRVHFSFVNGSWVVLTLEKLGDDETPEPGDESELEDQDESETELYFASQEDKESTCVAVEPFENTLIYSSTDPEAEDLNLSLVVTVEAPEDLVSQVNYTPEGDFTLQPPYSEQAISVDIQLAGELPPGVEVEVKIEVFDNNTEQLTGATYKVKLECEQEEMEEEEDLEDTEEDGDKCSRDQQHPHALTLFEEYGDRVGVDYDEIWSWFCEDNLGFGEIELAFKLFLEYGEALGEGYTVHEIIAMRLEGDLGWGQIKQEIKADAQENLLEGESDKKVPPGKEKSEEAKNKEKPNKKDK